jgi:carboxypeptidase C (cathepsin A)
MRETFMQDQLELLGRILDRNVSVLVYHGNFDMILTVSGMAEALHHVNWNRKHEWEDAKQKPYRYKTPQGVHELMGYKKNGGGLDFVVIRNSGHMVPMDKPAWSLQILANFVSTNDDSYVDADSLDLFFNKRFLKFQ